jgi:predicted lipoprotein
MKARPAVAAAALVALAAAGACRVATVRRLDEVSTPGDGSAAAERPFDAVALVDSAWPSEVLPALAAARDVSEIATGSGPGPFVVRGRGRVVDVDDRSRSGTARVELDGGGRSIVALQVGPVITGTAIRDALPAFAFDKFVNQIQHADAGNELNARVEQGVLQGLDRRRLRGRHVSFAGMASREEGALTITPVRLEVEGR